MTLDTDTREEAIGFAYDCVLMNHIEGKKLPDRVRLITFVDEIYGVGAEEGESIVEEMYGKFDAELNDVNYEGRFPQVDNE